MDLLKLETPLQPPFPDLLNWSENFCLASFDPRSGIGLWLHVGRWRKDLTLWREIVVLYFPNGTSVVHRAIGNERAAMDGPGGPNLAIRILADGHKLSYSFEGGARVVPSIDLRYGVVQFGPMESVKFDLVFESRAEIWDLHKVGDTQDFLGKGHIEQLGRVMGTVKVGDHLTTFDGKGNRDHSMGPRDNSVVKNHQWLQGYFSNGISFMVYDAIIRGQSHPIFSEVVVYEGDRLFEAKLEYPARIESVDDATKPYSFKIHYEKGSLEILTSEFVATTYLCSTAPNDLYVGVVPAGDPPFTLLEQSVKLTLNGEFDGFGNWERTVAGVMQVES